MGSTGAHSFRTADMRMSRRGRARRGQLGGFAHVKGLLDFGRGRVLDVHLAARHCRVVSRRGSHGGGENARDGLETVFIAYAFVRESDTRFPARQVSFASAPYIQSMLRAYLPTFPTSKYCCWCWVSCALRRCRLGVMLPLFVAMPRGGRFSLPRSRMTVSIFQYGTRVAKRLRVGSMFDSGERHWGR